MDNATLARTIDDGLSIALASESGTAVVHWCVFVPDDHRNDLIARRDHASGSVIDSDIFDNQHLYFPTSTDYGSRLLRLDCSDFVSVDPIRLDVLAFDGTKIAESTVYETSLAPLAPRSVLSQIDFVDCLLKLLSTNPETKEFRLLEPQSGALVRLPWT